MKKANIFLIMIFAWAQQNQLLAQNSPIIVHAHVASSEVQLDWFPVDVATWKEGLTSGYTLTRETVNGSGNFAPVRTMLKDTAWFQTNGTKTADVLSPIGQIIYKNNFLKKSNKENDAIQYNYIVYESTINIKVAEAIGLGFTDKNVVNGTTYKYTIKHNQSGQSSSVTIKYSDGENVLEPANYQPTFTWPNDQSLSDMLERSKPFELKAIIGKARPKIDSVIIRWAPTNVEICRNAMEDGYEIWRGRNVDSMKLLTIIKPWTEAQLRKMPQTDTLALLAAAYVMDKGIPQGMDKANMLDQALMESNYFGFGLTAADRSSLAADILGLRYVDKTVKYGESYRYEIRTKRLTPNFPTPDIIVTNEFVPLTAPEGFIIEKNEKSVKLRWLAGAESPYNSFIIERMNPGDSVYHSLTKKPIVFIKTGSATNNFHIYVDSLPSNNVVYQYRIKGLNAFGESSDYAYGHGFGRDKTPPEAVSIINGKFLKDSIAVRISWTPNTKDRDLKYHQVMVTNSPGGEFSAVSGELLPKDTVFIMSLKEMDIDQSFYFKVNSVDSSGNMTSSIAKFVFVPDNVRPEAPERITANISPEGWVTVTWSPSVSKDVIGYYVFYSNNDPNNLALQFDKPLNDTTYAWKIDINTLTKYLYVSVKAEDDNFNRSFLSEVLQLRRPDTIPPVKPYLAETKVNKDAVDISWKASASSDVVKYILYTQNPSDSIPTWVVIDSVDNKTLTYKDSKPMFGGDVQYAIKAVDDYGNQSPYSNTGQVYVPFPGHKYAPLLNILSENKNKSVSISWKKSDQSGLDQSIGYIYQVYKSIGSLDVAFYKEIPSSQFSMEDSDLQSGVLYNYAVRVRYNNGWTSELSEIKSILIK